MSVACSWIRETFSYSRMRMAPRNCSRMQKAKAILKAFKRARVKQKGRFSEGNTTAHAEREPRRQAAGATQAIVFSCSAHRSECLSQIHSSVRRHNQIGPANATSNLLWNFPATPPNCRLAFVLADGSTEA